MSLVIKYLFFAHGQELFWVHVLLGMKCLDKGEADGLISFGSTGAALVSGLFIAKRMENVENHHILQHLHLH